MIPSLRHFVYWCLPMFTVFYRFYYHLDMTYHICYLLSMKWVVEYYEQADTTQPAEEFEVSLKRHYKKLGAKLRAIATAIEVYGPPPS